MTTDSWINLLTAIGTIAAVAVAMIVSKRANNKADELAMTRAKLAAARIVAQLSTTADLVHMLAGRGAFLNLLVSEDVARAEILEEIASYIQKPFYRPDDATLLALTPLPNNCAHRIASAFDYLDRIRFSVGTFPRDLSIRFDKPAEREEILAHWMGDLDAADVLLTVALQGCVTARDLGAPMPMDNELYGNDD